MKKAAERARFVELSRAGRPVPVARAFPSDCLTPVMLFQRMRQAGREAFLLESVEGGESIARYTFLGSDPASRLVVRNGSAAFEQGRSRQSCEGDPLEALERRVRREGFAADPDLPPLSSGAVGYLSYDAVRLFEAIPDRHPRDGAIPDALFLLFDSVVAFDHPRQRVLLLTTLEPSADAGGAEEAATAAIARLDRLEACVSGPDLPRPKSPAPAPERWEPRVSESQFHESVAAIREAIAAGEVYQAVISQRWTARSRQDPFDVYRALRALNPSPYLFYMETREATLLGSSPEMLVRCRGDEVETRPIAGTVPRGATAAEDETLASRLLGDPKERAEHVMLVDLARNDLGRICQTGTVRVVRYAEVEKFSHVQHLVSEVRGRLRPGSGPADALAACFPAGTLTGAPKIRAMELIDSLETARRGIYGGAVGYLDAAGNCDMAIAIRAAVVEDGLWRIQAGAGIVADSDPAREYAEAQSKAAALFRAAELAEQWFA